MSSSLPNPHTPLQPNSSLRTISMSSDFDIVIVGAGAAGLAAGIFAGESHPNLSIALLDRAKTIGAKILISGGGRCNITNQRVTASDFHGTRKLIDRVLRRFDEQATIRWFTSLNIPLQLESTGKYFPVSNKARMVVDGLLQRCKDLGLSILTECPVQDLRKEGELFILQHPQGLTRARQVILATGGQSLPKTGSDGSGWPLAQHLGHTITPTYPALVPLLLEPSFFHADLSGLSHDVMLSTTVSGKTIDRRRGSLLWTHFGISGPVVLDTSRFWVQAAAVDKEVCLSLNCFPQFSIRDIEQWIVQSTSQRGKKTIASLLSERLPARLALKIAEFQKPNISQLPVNLLNKEARSKLILSLTNLRLPILGSRGWNFAEVTAGGIPLEEIHPNSMESRLIPGLYVIGEMLDCDGRIGGFNFQWAWATGYIAGTSAGLAVTKSITQEVPSP